MSTLRNTIETVLPRDMWAVYDIIDAHIRVAIAEALKAERERLATCFDRMSNAAYYDAQYDVSSAFDAAARELRE